jgi:hypothetical protein
MNRARWFGFAAASGAGLAAGCLKIVRRSSAIPHRPLPAGNPRCRVLAGRGLAQLAASTAFTR